MKDSSNVVEVAMALMGMSAFIAYLDAEDVAHIETMIGSVAAVDAHASVKLVYLSRHTLTEQARQLKIIAADLATDIAHRTKEFQPGGSLAEMTPEDKKRLSAVPLNNDMCERPFGLVGGEQKQKPNETLATSEATALAKINAPFEYIAERPVEEKNAIWKKSRQEQKKEQERNREHIERMQAQKREKIQKLIEAAKKRESKAAAEQAEFKDVTPINTVEELQEHLAGCDEAVKLDVLRDQIRNWNSKGVPKSKLSIGKDNKPEALQKKLEAYLEVRLDQVMAEAPADPPAKKRQASADSHAPNAAKRSKTDQRGTKRPREDSTKKTPSKPKSQKGKQRSTKAQSKGKADRETGKQSSSKAKSESKASSKAKGKSKSRPTTKKARKR